MDNKKSEEVTKFELFLIFVELQNQEYNEVTGNEGMLDDRKQGIWTETISPKEHPFLMYAAPINH